MARQEKLTILLIADNFDQQLLPLLIDCPWATRCFASKCILDLSLEWISQVDVPNIIIVSSSVELKILEDFKGKWKECFQSFIIVHLPNRKSVGDIMREIDAKNLLSGDFILIDNPATFSSSNLSKQITNFKKLRQRNKNNVMSLLYSRSEIEACQTIGFYAESGKLVLYNRWDDIPSYSLVKALFKTDSFVRSDLAPTGITFCALEILLLFSDNLDFLVLDDVIQDILINEEVHCRNIYVDV
uniref:Uncharacterized protein n=1 Tax=Acrobeloides nanus TaxID=290746 RepID=A0A914D1E8_9BILA